MTTALAAQLAQLRGQNTNPNDLKAQRQAHSQSLLFEPSHAVNQDFDSLYQFCLEGFEELCQLDSRFLQFAGSIFGEQSKHQDRNQMTKAQNEELNIVLDDFLCLVGARILLKPAIKAIEWMIRRFRVHETRTLVLIFAFLPYHTAPIFTTLISLLPDKLPHTLKWLYPYVQKLANPPRRVIVHSMGNSKSLLSAFSAFVLTACRAGYGFKVLISFWAALVIESISTMVDQARSARLEAQKENHENVLRLMLPIINDALLISGCPELRVGCYMVLTVMVPKLEPRDQVLRALMVAVVTGWGSTSHAGLICLAVLAEHTSADSLPSNTLSAVILLPDLDKDLKILHGRYEIQKLVLGIVLGILKRFAKTQDPKLLSLLVSVLSEDFLTNQSFSTIVRATISATQALNGTNPAGSSAQHALANVLLDLPDRNLVRETLKTILEKDGSDNTHSLPTTLRRLIDNPQNGSKGSVEDAPDMGWEEVAAPDSALFDDLAARIPTKTAFELSLLSHSDSYVYNSLCETFESVHASKKDLEKFSELPVLRKSLAMTEPFFCSFFMRVWCTNRSVPIRISALQCVTKFLKTHTLSIDVQILIPYVLSQLGSEHRSVRQAAIDLLRALSEAYGQLTQANDDKESRGILGQDQIYGQSENSTDVHWMSTENARRVLDEIILPSSAECILDEHHVKDLLRVSLECSKARKDSSTRSKELKTSSRTSIFSSMCSHVVNSSLWNFKLQMLRILNATEKAGSVSRTKLLLPVLAVLSTAGPIKAEDLCKRENVDVTEFSQQAVAVVLPNDRDGILQLKGILLQESPQVPPYLKKAVFRRLIDIWPVMKQETQNVFLPILFNMAIRSENDLAETGSSLTPIETLQSLNLSPSSLQSLFNEVSTMSLNPDNNSRASKRRRTLNGHVSPDEKNDSMEHRRNLYRTSLVLELVESSQSKENLPLLKQIFLILSDLLSAEQQPQQEMAYLQSLAIENISAIIGRSRQRSSELFDPSVIRADVLVEYIRTSPHPQVRNKALLLVATLADVVPDHILHSVMPLFTSLGSGILRQEDEFSVFVIQQVMESIIPKLLSKLKEKPRDTFAGTCELLLNFTAAFEHIPPQRRIPLFASLLGKIGAPDYLFALLVILSDKFTPSRMILTFAVQMCNRYNVVTNLKTMDKLLEIAVASWNPKHTKELDVLIADSAESGTDVSLKLLPLINELLRSRTLRYRVMQVLNSGGTDSVPIRDSSRKILEKLFLLSENCRGNVTLEKLSDSMLDGFLACIPTAELMDTINTLFEAVNDQLKRHMLRSVEQRMASKQNAGDEDSWRACHAFISQLLTCALGSADNELQISAMVVLGKMVEKFGKTNLNNVATAARKISESSGLLEWDLRLRTVSLLTLASMIEVAGETLASVLPTIFSKTMDNFDMSISEATEDPDLHNATFTVLQTMLLYVPWIISGPYLDRILTASHESANAEMGEACDVIRRQTLNSITNRDNGKDCLSALERTWRSAMTEGPRAIKEHFEIFRSVLQSQTKAKTAQDSEILGTNLTKAFNLRNFQLSPRTDESYEDNEIAESEEIINDATIAMIYKMNDASFRPLFTRILDWATITKNDGQWQVFRLITWYIFLFKFFSTLKSIVTSYAALIIDNAVNVLEHFQPDDETYLQLWRGVVNTLHQTFEHDQDEFYQNPSHFSPVSQALLAQLGHASSLPDSSSKDAVISAITSLAASVPDSSGQHKEMNTAILQHLRSASAAVRLAAVQSQRSLTGRLGEEWLALLPEMLPFINELQEDDDEDVERETLDWIREIEGILGESVNDMLG